MKIITIGLDISKSVFQVYAEDGAGAVVLQKQLRRGQVPLHTLVRQIETLRAAIAALEEPIMARAREHPGDAAAGQNRPHRLGGARLGQALPGTGRGLETRV